MNKTILNPNPVALAELGIENNPFADRPSTAQQQALHEAETQFSLNDLDHIENAPHGVDQMVWNRFVECRRGKIALETSLRMKLLNLNEMILYLQKISEDDELKRREIDELTKLATK